MKQRYFRVDEAQIADQGFRLHEADWNVSPAFGRYLWNDNKALVWHVLDMEPRRFGRKFPCWCAFARQTKLANCFDTLHYLGHLPEFVRFAVPEPQAPPFPTVEKLGRTKPASKPLF